MSRSTFSAVGDDGSNPLASPGRPLVEHVLGLQRELLAASVDGGTVARLLERVARFVEKSFPGVLCRVIARAGGAVDRRDPEGWSESAGGEPLDVPGDPLEVCATGGQSVSIPDFRSGGAWPRHAALALLRRLRSCHVEPLPGRDGESGAIAVYSGSPAGPGERHVEFVSAVAGHVALALSACRKSEKDAADASRFHSLSRSIPGVVYQRLVTPGGDIRYTYVSESASELFGVAAERIVGDPEALFQHYDQDYRDSFRGKLIEASRAMAPWDVEARIVRPDGEIRHTHAVARPARLADGSVLWTGVILNAERIKQAERAAAEAEARTREAIVDSMSQGMVLFDRDDRLVIANRYFRELYPTLREEVAPGTLYRDFILAEQRALKFGGRETDHEELARRLGQRDEGGYVAERRVGDERWIMVSENRTADGGTVILHTDVSELKTRERRIHHLAYHDVLTGLPNRASFLQRLNDELTRCRKARESLAVLCIDLDGFKHVNDTLGHPFGDELLVEIARRIKDNIREVDVSARLGGDEFAIVVSDNVSVETVTGIAWRLLHALAEPVMIRDQQVVTTASIGVAFALPGEETDPDFLMKCADLALYRSKSDGRDTFRFFETEMDAIAQRRRRLENDLRLALERDELELYFQPLVDVYTEEVMGAEALVRWRHPERGLISPLDFIALAEETGIIVRIGAWVLRRACIEASQWPSSVRVAVNLSPAQFRDRDLVPGIQRVLEEVGLPPNRLELEITESLLLRDTAANLQTLNEIKALGVRISMDDFGTGYSSLGNLRSFPFDKIKIDRSFVNDLETSADSAAIVRAVLSLGRGMGMTTTAEGVENLDQLAYLRAEGCSEVQGFYFSEPRPAAEIAKMLREGFPKTPANGRK